MACAICEFPVTEGAHVKPREDFDEGENDRASNIIPLCPNCHTVFDQNVMGILPDKSGFVRMGLGGRLEEIRTRVALDIRDEYVSHRNDLCDASIQYWISVWSPPASPLKSESEIAINPRADRDLVPAKLEATCPHCGKAAKGYDAIQEKFGFRFSGGKTIPQSWCQDCRGGKNRTNK